VSAPAAVGDNGSRLRHAVSDSAVLTMRHLRHIPRIPELLVFSIIQPIIFVLLFAFVFGGAIQVPGGGYRSYLMAGIFAQTVAFTGASTGVGLAEDMARGLIDRFRSLPMARSAVLAGRTLSDLLRSVLILVVMSVCGLLVGWRTHTSAASVLWGYLLLLLFGFAMSWIGAWIGLIVPSTEVANTAGFIWLFPLTFMSNAFVPIQTMPSWLQTFVAWNPISATVQAVRSAFGNTGIAPTADFWPLKHADLVSVAWSLLLVVVFGAMAIRRYRTASRR
jgi:ABC-2 type transport system permease protein